MQYFFPGDHIEGRYLVNNIKKGGMGIVYLCHDKLDDMPIALKTFRCDLIENWKTIIDRFIHEARIWILVGRAKNVVEAYYIVNTVSDEEIIPYIAIELIKGHPSYGTSLRGWIHNSGLDLKLILLFSIEICSGMIHIHNKLKDSGYNFVHQDLKPENILISGEGSIKITDFGIATVFQDNISKITLQYPTLSSDGHYTFGLTQSLFGTPPYMSPEQCKGSRSIDQRSDIYSFGCILYEMFTKKYIFPANSPESFLAKHIHERPVPAIVLNLQMPSSLSKLIDACLEKNVINRPNNFEEVRTYLRTIMDQQGFPSNLGLKFWTFGFSSFTDKPRIKSDWNIIKEEEAILLGETFGVNYAISQGLVEDEKEYDLIIKDFKNLPNLRQSKHEKRVIEDRVNELCSMGDSLFRLSESSEGDKQIHIMKEALNKYYSAQKLKPLEPRICFRIGMSYNTLAYLMKEQFKSYSDELIQLSIEEFNFTITQQKIPLIDYIGTTLYILPFSALYYRGVSLFINGDINNAINDWQNLIDWLDREDLSQFKKLKEILRKNTEEVLNVVRNKSVNE